MKKFIILFSFIVSTCFGQFTEGVHNANPAYPELGAALNHDHPLAIDMFAGWLFNTGGMKVYDIVRYKKNSSASDGTWQGTDPPDLILTQYGRLPKFSGLATSHYYKINDLTTVALNVPDVNKGLTIVAFVRNDDTNERRIISKALSTSGADHIWMLGNISTQAWRARVNISGTTQTLVTANNTNINQAWYLVAVTYDGAELRLHTIGVNVSGSRDALKYTTAAASYSGALASNGYPVYIGYNPGGASTANWLGHIRWIYLYNRALSVDEFYQLYYDPYQMFVMESLIIANRLFPTVAAEAAGVRPRVMILQ
jgi:hypothetical protein